MLDEGLFEIEITQLKSFVSTRILPYPQKFVTIILSTPVGFIFFRVELTLYFGNFETFTKIDVFFF